MRAILILTLKDLRRRLANPAALLLLLAIPLALAATMALAFGHRPGGEELAPVLRLLIADLDNTPFSGIIMGASQNPEVAKRMEIHQVADRDEGLKLLRDEDYAALLIIPKRFSDDLLRGTPAELEVIKNPAQSVMPLVAEQGIGVLALYISTAKRLIGPDAETVRRLLDGKGWDDSLAIASLVTTTYGRVKGADNLLFPPIVEVKTQKKDKEAGGFDFMAWMYPGLMVMGLLYLALAQMRDLLTEHKNGTLRRQLAAPLGAGQVLLSKLLSVAAVVAFAHAILLGIGWLAFGVTWGSPGPLAITSILIVSSATGFAALLYSLVRTERQADAFGGILVMVMALVGGSFVPPQLLPDWLQTVALFAISHWSVEALRVLTIGGAWDRLAPLLAVLAAMSLVFITISVGLLARRHRAGTL